MGSRSESHLSDVDGKGAEDAGDSSRVSVDQKDSPEVQEKDWSPPPHVAHLPQSKARPKYKGKYNFLSRLFLL